MKFNVDTFFADASANATLFAYKGSISTDFINSALTTVDEKMSGQDEDARMRKRVYNILIESLQNLFHHAEKYNGNGLVGEMPRFGIIILSQTDHGYHLKTGNFVSNERVTFLQNRLEKINSLSLEEIKDMYKYILNHQRLSEKGGGGLGLLDIARRNDKNFEYQFIEVDEKTSFFNFDIFIERNV